jgi:hypothetical protein
MGSAVLEAYVRNMVAIQRVAYMFEPRPVNTLKGFFLAFAPSGPVAFVLYGAAAVLTVVLATQVWRRVRSFEIRFSAVVLAMILISPHAFEYDLILLTPVFFLLATRIAESRVALPAPMTWALCALFVAPLLNGLPTVLRLQFSVTAMAVVLTMLWASARRPILELRR